MTTSARRRLQALEVDQRVPRVSFPDPRSTALESQSVPEPEVETLDPQLAEAFQAAVASHNFERAYTLYQAHSEQLRALGSDAQRMSLEAAFRTLATAFSDAARREEQRNLQRAAQLFRRSLHVVPHQPVLRSKLARVQSMIDNLQRIRADATEDSR